MDKVLETSGYNLKVLYEMTQLIVIAFCSWQKALILKMATP
jgi:hypothetical protein